ncbi:EpsG family protein, partial [Planktomarina temperata]|nr:EpsG family protein [Planktomarina temperata]
MIFYNFIFFSLVLLQLSLKKHDGRRTLVYLITLCVLFIFSGFRYEVGCDWTGYLNQWEIQKNLPLQIALLNSEPLWWAMIDLIQSSGASYPWMNVASSGIFFLGVHVIARRQPDPLGFLILLFPILIINMPMSGIRQAAGIGIMCFAIISFIDKRTFWFVTFVLLAAAFHNSAIIFLLLAPLVGENYSRSRLYLATLLA